MLDRRKLAAPLFAQAAAFVAVLVIGGFTGHSSTKAAAPAGSGQTAVPTAAASASSAAGKGAALKLTVRVITDGQGLLALSGRQVNVLQDDTLTSVMTGTLNSALEFAANVPSGQYQVCIDPPIGWASQVRTTNVLGGWICSSADLRTSPQLVTFRLTSQAHQVSQ
jgi:hypothetical protein